MSAVPGRLRLTVLGCSTALPAPDAAAAGFLVELDDTAVLFDVGQGVANRLGRLADARELAGVVIGHMHADHFLDLAGLRYLFPWAGRGSSRLPVHLPPGGTSRLDDLASAISERNGFFDDAYAVDEYDPDTTLTIGQMKIRFAKGRHYVPAWGVSVETPDGARLVYTGDTGPSASMIEFARGADVLLVEATLNDSSEDDVERGHLTGRGGDRPGARGPGRGRTPRPLPARPTGGAGSAVRGGRPLDRGGRPGAEPDGRTWIRGPRHHLIRAVGRRRRLLTLRGHHGRVGRRSESFDVFGCRGQLRGVPPEGRRLVGSSDGQGRASRLRQAAG